MIAPGLQGPLPAEAVRAELQEVLRRTDLRSSESLLERFLEWLAPHLSTTEVETLGDVLLGILVAGAVVAGGLLLARAWRLFRADTAEAPAGAEEEGQDPRAPLREVLERARAARAAGDPRLALRLLLHALLLALGGRGDLELRAAWTNRELLRRGRPSAEARALLEPLVRELEPKEFGRAPVESRDLERLEGLLAPHLTRPRGGA